ncbi:MAG TPA: class I SAM-dependent methyltransferase [Mycobacteriales bacterium]|nr:class I SAM-dependent methyltransferase [Mycobacteriales bacterium]
MAGAGAVRAVNNRGVVLDVAGSDPLVVELDGRFAWSFTPARDRLPRSDRIVVAWPPVMKPYLNGVAHVLVRDVAGLVHFDDDISFGDGEGRVALVDEDGFALSVDKAGHLVRAFSERDDTQRGEILDGVLRLLTDLRDRCGIEAFLNFGALLGAVREGGMLGHDSDVDLAYVSKHASPADVILESYGIERGLRDLGWPVIRMGGNDVKASLYLADGSRCQIDIFPGFFVDGIFYLLPNRSGALTRDDLLPTTTVTLLGREFPAPRRPEAMLEYLYGPGWRVPDPSFQFDNPPAGVRRINGWLRGAQHNVQAWVDHWNTPAGKAARPPSEFAGWVHDRIGAGAGIVELGSARGVDATYFVEQGHPVLASDFASSALNQLRALASQFDETFPGSYEVLNIKVGDLRHAMWLGARLARDPRHLYVRQLLGALPPKHWEWLWTVAAMGLRRDNKLFLEFSAAGENLPPSKVFRQGMMRRIDADRVCADITERGGTIEHRGVAAGTDAWGNPDPNVCRLVVSWQAKQSNRKAVA